MNDSTPIDNVDAGEATMRGLINTVGISKAVVVVADMYAAPGNDAEQEQLAGMLLAAYRAGQLNMLNEKAAV